MKRRWNDLKTKKTLISSSVDGNKRRYTWNLATWIIWKPVKYFYLLSFLVTVLDFFSRETKCVGSGKDEVNDAVAAYCHFSGTFSLNSTRNAQEHLYYYPWIPIFMYYLCVLLLCPFYLWQILDKRELEFCAKMLENVDNAYSVGKRCTIPTPDEISFEQENNTNEADSSKVIPFNTKTENTVLAESQNNINVQGSQVDTQRLNGAVVYAEILQENSEKSVNHCFQTEEKNVNVEREMNWDVQEAPTNFKTDSRVSVDIDPEMNHLQISPETHWKMDNNKSQDEDTSDVPDSFFTSNYEPLSCSKLTPHTNGEEDIHNFDLHSDRSKFSDESPNKTSEIDRCESKTSSLERLVEQVKSWLLGGSSDSLVENNKGGSRFSLTSIIDEENRPFSEVTELKNLSPDGDSLVSSSTFRTLVNTDNVEYTKRPSQDSLHRENFSDISCWHLDRLFSESEESQKTNIFYQRICPLSEPFNDVFDVHAPVENIYSEIPELEDVNKSSKTCDYSRNGVIDSGNGDNSDSDLGKMNAFADLMNRRILGKKNRTWLINLYVLEILNFTFWIIKIYSIHKFINGHYFDFGFEVNRNKVFPKLSRCTFTRYGPSGTQETRDFFCLLPLNAYFEIFILSSWFLDIFIGFILAMNFLMRMCQRYFYSCRFYSRLFGPSVNPEDHVWICRLAFSDWLFISYIGGLVEEHVYKAAVSKIRDSGHSSDKKTV